MKSLQLLILGNGFDLHCGLKSSYKDFFRSEILDLNSEHSDYPIILENCKGFWEQLLFEHYKIYRNCDYKWCDIEEIIKNTLCLIYHGRESKSINLKNSLWRIALSFIEERRDLLDDRIYQDEPIVRFIFIKIVKLFESIKYDNYSVEERLHLLSVYLLQELKNFERRFCKYIKGQLSNSENQKVIINTEYILASVNLLAQLTGFSNYVFSDLNSVIYRDYVEFEEPCGLSAVRRGIKLKDMFTKEFGNLSNTYIINFNYTNFFDILHVDSPCPYNNVHGKLCNDMCIKECTLSSVIFGIDDTLIQSQETNSEMRLFSKTYRKMLNIGNPLTILPPKNNNAVEIKFYGHSLGEADYSYFQSIFDYYDLYENNNVSLTFYYSNGFEQYDEIYKLMSSYGKTLINREQGKNLLHKLLLENRLKITKVKD